MKRTISLMLTMVLLLSILVGCNNNGASDISSDLSEVTSSSTEQVDSNFETTEVESTTTESGMQEENSTVSNSETTSTTTKPSANSNNSQTTKPNTNSTTSNTTTKPSTSNSTTGNNNSSSSNTNSNSNWLDGYVYKDPTVFVAGMYTIDNAFERYDYEKYNYKVPANLRLRMGELYVDRNYVAQIYLYADGFGNVVEFDTNHIVTDVNKMPSNYQLYPYVIDTIPNWLYEKNITIDNCKGLTPIELYARDNLGGYKATIISFYNAIGDIDYNSIDVQKMHDGIKSTIADPYNQDPIDMNELNEYVSYVKNNNIKITTKAEPLLPIIYNNGDDSLLRTKVTVNVESTKTNEVRLFLHENLTLTKGTNVFYIDVPLMYDTLFATDAHVDIFAGDISKYIIA